MWGLLGKAAVGLMKFPLKNKLLTAVGAGAVYWNKDALAEKKDELVEQYNEQGLAETANSLKNDIAEGTTSLVSGAGDTLDTAKEVVNDPTGFADRQMGEAFDRVMNPDGDDDPNNPANHNESGSIFSAVGKLIKGDFAGAASAFSGDDGFGWGDGAKLGVVGAILMGIFKLFTGDKDENENDGGFDLINGTTITIGLAALAFFNRGFIMEKVNDFTGGDQDNTFDNSAFDIG